MAQKNLYAILGVDVDADERRIREVYRSLAKKFHPDLNPGNPKANERFKEIAHAYWVLSDLQRKKAYLDANPFIQYEKGRSWKDEFSSADYRAEEFARTVPKEGRDILVRLYVSLEELSEGVMKKVTIRRRQSCPDCGGTGIQGGAKGGICPACQGKGEVPDFMTGGKSGNSRSIPCRKCGGSGTQPMKACRVCNGKGQDLRDVSITVGVPPGSQDQGKVVVKGQGHEGQFGGNAGDLRVIIVQKEHPYFLRKGDDLIYQSAITFTQWLEGCEMKIPTLNGTVSLRINPGVLPDGTLKIRGRGMPKTSGGRGDIIVKYNLCKPGKLNRKQLALLKRLEATEGFSPQLDERGWCIREAAKTVKDGKE